MDSGVVVVTISIARSVAVHVIIDVVDQAVAVVVETVATIFYCSWVNCSIEIVAVAIADIVGVVVLIEVVGHNSVTIGVFAVALLFHTGIDQRLRVVAVANHSSVVAGNIRITVPIAIIVVAIGMGHSGEYQAAQHHAQ
jgi:hypothetical protein